MDTFRLRETLVADYAEYVQRLLAILDPRIRAFVDTQLAASPLRPDLYFEPPGGPVCVFCDDAPPPPEVLGLRADLEDLGYRVYAVRSEDDLDQRARRLSR
jgi:hypothetical protein